MKTTMDKKKLKNLLNKLDSMENRIPGNEAKPYLDGLLNEETEKFKQRLSEDPTVKVLNDFGKKLEQIKKDTNLDPIKKSIEGIQKEISTLRASAYDQSQQIAQQTGRKTQELEGLVNKIKGDTEGLTAKDVQDIQARIKTIENDLNYQSKNSENKGKTFTQVTQDLEKKLKGVLDKLADDSKNQSTFSSSMEKKIDESIKEAKSEIEKVRKELFSRLGNFGGGNANRNIAIAGNSSILSRYTDINFKNSDSIGWSAVNNDTTKQVDITASILTSGGGGGGGVVTSVLSGTGIVVDSSTPETPIVNLGNTSVIIGTYGSDTTVPRITIDQQGRISAASTVGITFPAATTPGGSDTEVQFNDNGAFGGISRATWNKNASILTFVTPSIASFAQAQHNHQDGAGGGQLAASSVFTMTGGQIKTSVLGTGTADATTFLRGDSTWAAPGGGGAWTLVNYSTASAATSITVSSLNLSTDKRYLIMYKVSGDNSNCSMRLTVNGNSDANYYNYGAENAAGTVTGFGNAAGTFASLNSTAPTGGQGHIEMQLVKNDGTNARPSWIFDVIAVGTNGNANLTFHCDGAGMHFGQTNVTSVTITNGSGNNKDWELWVLKPNTA